MPRDTGSFARYQSHLGLRQHVRQGWSHPIPLLTTPQEGSPPKFSSHLRQHLFMPDILSKRISLSWAVEKGKAYPKHLVTHNMKWTGIRKGSEDLGLHSPGGRVSPLPEHTHCTITHPDILHSCVVSVTSSIWLISLDVKQYQVGIKLCQAASGTGQAPWPRVTQSAQPTLCSYLTPAFTALPSPFCRKQTRKWPESKG